MVETPIAVALKNSSVELFQTPYENEGSAPPAVIGATSVPESTPRAASRAATNTLSEISLSPTPGINIRPVRQTPPGWYGTIKTGPIAEVSALLPLLPVVPGAANAPEVGPPPLFTCLAFVPRYT